MGDRKERGRESERARESEGANAGFFTDERENQESVAAGEPGRPCVMATSRKTPNSPFVLRVRVRADSADSHRISPPKLV